MSMHFEFAVDPIAISSEYMNFKIMEDRFGFAHGRLISKFPMKWDLIFSVMSERFKLNQKKNLEIKLLHWKRRGTIIDTQRGYNPDETWLANALKQHESNKFQAIVTDKKCSTVERLLHIAEINDDTEFFKIHKSKEIPATGEEISNNLELMLRTANTVIFIDPYFDLYDPEYVETLECCLQKIWFSGKRTVRCEIHFCKNKKNQSPERIEELLHETRIEKNQPPERIEELSHETRVKKLLSNAIGLGASFKFFSWVKGELHDRFLLTNFGGVQSGQGFRALPDKNLKYNFTLIDWDFCQKLREKYKLQPTDIKLNEPVLDVSQPPQPIVDKTLKVTRI